ncbi:MAG: M28 family peptidase [Gemmatimonadetes bacterium]|nr:M28 family peptidase [Gemmatimonadota bacterium]MXX70799.1 M28 family peptidase [Gemmatimonadota bacterium]MYC90765.1 M28 family peptidase [Gemmatimonadota bacterium]MYG35549.1 M28 family peptidase [Gemmatimonadota bacterium]MYJ18429.1 M28 family peptidase [Gemmatimonadota bacterium]
MGKDKLPRIPSFAELGISEDEIEELEREIADEVAARKRRETGEGAPAEGPPPGPGSSSPPGSGRASGGPDRASGTAPERTPESGRAEGDQKARPAERKRRAAQARSEARKKRLEARKARAEARKSERQQKARAASEARQARREGRALAAEQAAQSDPHPAAAPWGGLRGPLTLVVLLLTAWFSSSYRAMPAPVPATAADSIFSSGRAMAHLVRIASEARPPGSPAHARVREYLVDELRRLGHEPEVQTSTSVVSGSSSARAATVRNVLARIPGSEPGGRAVLVTAHYDSREIALGAGDDGSGVVAILESLRALGVLGQLRNDLIVLITDGEELGLLGARAFVDEHPWMDDVAVVVAIEMRGGGGASIMFETGENNGWVVEQLRLADPYPSTNSVSFEIYPRMPNDTDFTPFREAGRQGLNFAAVGRPHVYHQVYDSPGNLSEATVQHHGEHVLAMLRHLGNVDLTSVDAPNVSYISVPYLGLVTYGTVWIWALGIVAVLLWVALFVAGRRFGARTGAVVIALLASLAYLAMSGALARYLFEWRSGAHPELGALHGGAFHVEGWYVLAIVFAALSLAALVAGVLRVWLTAAEVATGALIVPVGLAAAATAMFPMAAMNLQWPSIAACIGGLAVVGLARTRPMGLVRWVLVLLAAIPAVVVFTPLTEAVWMAMGLELAVWLAVLIGIAFIALLPVLEVLREPNAWWAPVGVLMAGGAFLAVGMSTATPSADRPAPSTLVYALDHETGAAWWGTDPSRDGSDPGVAWATVVAGPFDAASAADSLRGFAPSGRGYAVARAEAVDAPPPSVSVVADSASAADVLRLSVTSAIGAEMMLFRFDGDGTRPTAVNGRELPAGADWTSVEHWGAPEGGVLLDLPGGPGDGLVGFTIVEHHLRPGELVGADRFRRPSELAPNIRTLSDRAMIRTRVTVDPATGEVRFPSPADPAEQAAEPGPAADTDPTPAGDSADVVEADTAQADTAQADTTGASARDTIPHPDTPMSARK